MSLMVKYGLHPGTLKGELFGVLLERGIHGLKDSELAKSLQWRNPNQIPKTREQLMMTSVTVVHYNTEIDESHPGEVWLLGLMEGEYSDLSIEEKLSTIVAPIDLLHASSSFRMEVTYRIFAWTMKPFLCFYFSHYYEVALLNGKCSVLCKIISSEWCKLHYILNTLTVNIILFSRLNMSLVFFLFLYRILYMLLLNAFLAAFILVQGRKLRGYQLNNMACPGHTSGAKEDCTLKFHPIDSSGSISKFSDERFSTKEKNGKEREDIEGFISNLQKMYILLDLVCSRWSAKGGQITSGDMVIPDNYKITIASVLAACAHLGAFDHGIWVFQEMPNKDTLAWTAMISVLALHWYGNEAFDIFRQMETTGVKPNHVTFVGLLSACAHSGLVEKGRWCFRVMKRVYLIEPQLYRYAGMVDMLIRSMPMKPDTFVLGALYALIFTLCSTFVFNVMDFLSTPIPPIAISLAVILATIMFSPMLEDWVLRAKRDTILKGLARLALLMVGEKRVRIYIRAMSLTALDGCSQHNP
ncbi:unnamed protein product [Prunus brigantina]